MLHVGQRLMATVHVYRCPTYALMINLNDLNTILLSDCPPD